MREVSLEELVKDAVSVICQALLDNKFIGPNDDFDIGDVFDDEEKYKSIWMDADASNRLGYLNGMADAFDITVKELLAIYSD